MADPNNFAGNFISLLNDFQAKKPINKKSGDDSKEQSDDIAKSNEGEKGSGGARRREREERGDYKGKRRRNQDNTLNKRQNLNSADRGDFNDSLQDKRKQAHENQSLQKEKFVKSNSTEVSDQFFSVLDDFGDKLNLNEQKVPKTRNQNNFNLSETGANRTRNNEENRNEGKRDFPNQRIRGENSNRNHDRFSNKNDSNRDGGYSRKESEKISKKVMGFKFLESLLECETSMVITTLASPRSGFQELVNSYPIRPDLLMLILKVLDKINMSEANQLKVQIFSSTFKPEFIDEIKKFVSLVCVEDNRKRLLGMRTFFANVLNVLDSVVNCLPSTMNEKLKSTLNALNLSMKSLRDEQNMKVDDHLFDQLKELTDQVNSFIEHNSKIDKKQNHVGKKEIPPPNSYRDIPLVPTSDDISTDRSYLRQNIIRGSYSNVDHYLDVQFRLLREDFIAPLREGIQEYIENPHSKRRYSNVRIYPKVKFDVPFKSRDIFGFYIKFDCDKRLPKNINWEYNKRFMSGSLLLFSIDNFESFYLATVVERNISKLKEGLLFVTFVPGTDVPEYLFDPGVFFVMAESEVYYEAYKHVLSALQRMNENNFPMEQYIVNVDTACFPPAYLMDNAVYEISGFNVNLLDNNSWPQPEELKLNPSQYKALKSALTNDFVVIQGPPGTGKTFLALKITEILLKNEVSCNTPIVVICYTNHALDQFLEGILKYTKNVIRIGMQSQHEVLQKYTLEVVRKKMKESRNINFSVLFRETMNEKFQTQSRLQVVKEKIDELSNPKGILDINVLKSVIPPQQYNELGGQILSWLFCYDDHEFHMMKSSEEYAETLMEVPIAQNQNEMIPEQLSDLQVEETSDLPEEEFEELDDEENARRLADMTEDDFFEEDFLHEGEFDKNVSYSLMFEHIDNEIDEIRHRMKITTHQNDDIKYYFDQQCIQQIEELKWQKRFLQEQFFRFSAYKFNPERLGLFQNVESVWEIGRNDRWEYYATWVHLYICQLKQILQHLTKIYQDLLIKLHELRQLEDLRFVQTASVVGLTTSGAAKRRVLLESLNTKIVIVEEAAEVLEAHIVTSLAHSVQHVILIGDHKQLKPNPAVFKLAKKYNMDCSLFERMLNNGLGCSVLNEQHRMRPEIASLITPTIYPHLANHPSTLDRPKIRGVDRFVFFLSHDQPEDQLPDSTSKQNTHEADLLMELCKYLLLNEYKPEEITILATYVGQVWYMKKMRREMGKSIPQIRDVRITPVDNFQGEENRIILLSLVRSNKEQKIGFLSTENRVCVALSRAKEGLYIVGNMDNLTNSSTIWPKIKAQLESINAFGHKLVLRCERHPDQITHVSHKKDFKRLPEGGCSLKCETELICGHICPRVCHIIDRDHGFYKCRMKCERPPCDVEGHKCPLLCYQLCEPCRIPVVKPLPCGHSATLRCHEEPAAQKCLEKVPAVHPACKHEIVKFCYLDVDKCRCTNDCTIRLPCGHACENKCHINDDPDHIQYKCLKDCVKEYKGCPRNKHPCPKRCYEECGDCQVSVGTTLPCGHHHKIPCSADPETFKCTRECTRIMDCKHKCKEKCWVKCDPTKCTVLVDKKADCGHIMYKMKCNEPTEKRICKQKCERKLPCGHQCHDKCCNDCSKLPCKELVESCVKLKCGHPSIKIPCHLNKKELNGGSDELLERCEQPCGQLMRCGHVCKGKCGNCLQGRLHVPCQEKCNKTLVCGHQCNNKCSVLCPPCLSRKCLIRCSHKQCFIQGSKNHTCFSHCNPTCERKCEWSCEHLKCERRCWDECSRPPCLLPCPKKLLCGHDCMGFCGEVCPRVCAVCNEDIATPGQRYVLLEDCKHVVESRVMDTLVKDATRYNIFRLMVCPRPECDIPVVNTPRYRHVYLGFRRQIVMIENILKNDETLRLLRLHARHSDVLGSKPTSSQTLNLVMEMCSKPFRFFPGNALDQKEMVRLILGCLLQPLAVRCVEIHRSKHEKMQGGDKIDEQRLMLRLEYLAVALIKRMDQISYDAVLQIELLVVQILRLTSKIDHIYPDMWYDVTPYNWQLDNGKHYVEQVPRVSASLRTRDSAKQWFICDRQHMFVSEGGVGCVVCRDEEEENQRRLEEEARSQERGAQSDGRDTGRFQRSNQGPVVTDYRRAGRGRGRGRGGGKGKGNRGGGQGGRGRGRAR